MTDKENILSMIKKQGYERVPVDFLMTPICGEKLRKYVKENKYKYKRLHLANLANYYPEAPFGYILDCNISNRKPKDYYRQFYNTALKKDTKFDVYGVAMEAGSEDAMHLRRFHHPMQNFTTLEEIKNYPYPEFKDKVNPINRLIVMLYKAMGKFIIGPMECTIWEQSWYLRSMENIMMDMLCDKDMANAVLDRVCENSIIRARNYVRGGADGLFLGDDIGMQSSIMMSEEMYVEFIKPRLKKVIDAAREVNKDVIIFYHSCGYIEPFIPHLIEVGVDVLNPVQPECMSVKDIVKKFGDKLAFSGGMGTQTLMPFGTPAEIRDYVFDLLDFMGDKGGFLVKPTHVLEPEVPPENIIAYIEACKEYSVNKLSKDKAN